MTRDIRTKKYSAKLADEICDKVASGKNLTDICKADNIPSCRTVYYWRRKNPKFDAEYKIAESQFAEAKMDSVDDLATKIETGEIDHRVGTAAIHARQWQVIKKAPQKYGDRVQQEVTQKTDLSERSDDELLRIAKQFVEGRNA